MGASSLTAAARADGGRQADDLVHPGWPAGSGQPHRAATQNRAKDFYVDRLGFNVDVDVRPADGVRVVQLTPPERLHRPWRRAADDCDGTGVDQGLHLVVRNIAEARDTLAGWGVEVGDIDEQAQGVKYAVFSDPEGNTWALQAMPWRSQAWS